MSSLAFASPWLLLGLIALPIIWWLLRLTPPKPNQELFPPFELLKQLFTKEDTPHQSPWWLTLIRLLMAAAIIIALARPLLNPNATAPLKGDHLAVIVDNGWAAAPRWDDLLRTTEAVLNQAQADNVPVLLALTADDGRQEIGPFSADQAMGRLRLASPQAVPNDRLKALNAIIEAAANANIDLANLDLVVMMDGTAADAEALAPALDAFKNNMQIYSAASPLPPVILRADNGGDSMRVVLASAQGDDAVPLRLTAKDDQGRVIAQSVVETASREAVFALPNELRNDFAQIVIDGQAHGGATFLLDESNRRRRIGLLAASNAEDGQPLLAPLYYINRALAPIADLVVPQEDSFEANVRAVLDQSPSVIIMADIGAIPDRSREQLENWLEAGGTLIRFAGPRLAANVSAGPDPLLPVILRQGERSLEGVLSWAEPQKLVAFPDQSPFAGLALPRDVEVKRQILAQPTADILERSWAVLEDGTPLVTGKAVGEGSLVLFHVVPEATWSNLPISGSFVDILSRLTRLSKGQVIAQNTDGEGAEANLPLWQLLNGQGNLELSDRQVAPIAEADVAGAPTYASPAGLYGSAEGFIARNLFTEDRAPLPLPANFAQGQLLPLLSDATTALANWFWLGAAALFVMDCIAILFLGGGLFRRKATRSAASLLVLLMFVMPFGEAHAQGISAEDQAILDQISVTRLAYVITGNAAIDDVSEAGLLGLTQFLQSRTSIEPGPPIGVALESDNLALFPMLYYPIDTQSPAPSAEALSRLDQYMRNGGSVLFDTRDGLQTNFGGQSREAQILTEIVRDLNIPPLEPVPENHVLRRSFYILPGFPGRYSSTEMWVEVIEGDDEISDRPVRRGDGVSAVMITGNDMAAAWAIGGNGAPLYATVPPDPRQRELAYRAGVNIIMYMLTGNYKADQVHIPALLERLGQ